MIATTCHCGAIRIEIASPPTAATICNCSICRRYGALWAFYEVGSVRVNGAAEDLVEYVWGEKTIRTMRCRQCGCVTHWEPLLPEAGNKLGVNLRNFEPSELGEFEIRRFDGADTWSYLE